MITKLIESIDDIRMKSSLNVCDAIMNVIDKNELIREYDESSVLDDVVMESMMLFMEYVSPTKDAITKWMDENGYFYKGTNPNKKKKCLRMYNFLKQHDFRPSDQTYKSSFVLRDGTYKRIKLDIDSKHEIVMDDEDRANIQKLLKRFGSVNKNGKMYIDMEKIKKAVEEDEDIDSNQLASLEKGCYIDSVVKGTNAFYATESDHIAISAKTLQGKQAISQFMLKHEEGHAEDFNKDIPAQRRSDIDNTKEKSVEYKKKTINKGLFSNWHDIMPEESAADAYAVQHAEKRGKKGSRKKLNNHDLLRIFRDMDQCVQKSESNMISIKKCESHIDTFISDFEELINNVEKHPKYLKEESYFEMTSSFDVNTIVSSDREYQSLIKNIEKLNLDKLDEKALMEKDDQLYKEIRDYRKKLLKIQEQLYQLEPDLKNVEFKNNIDGFSSQKIEDLEKEKAKLEDAYHQLIEARQAVNDILYDRVDTKTKSHEADIQNTISKASDKSTLRFDMSKGSVQNLSISVPKKLLTKIHDEAKGDKDKAYKIIADYYLPVFRRWIAILKKKKANLAARAKALGEFKDVSTAVRYNFAKKFIKEYFDDFFGDSDLYME